MRLSDAGMQSQKTKLIYSNHQSSPWLTEATARDRSNRLLEAYADRSFRICVADKYAGREVFEFSVSETRFLQQLVCPLHHRNRYPDLPN